MVAMVSPTSLITPTAISAGHPRHPTAGIRSGNLRVSSPWSTSASLQSSSALKKSRKEAGWTQVAHAAVDKVESSVTELQELTKLDYYQYIEDAGEDIVVVDFYTDWCGPCKLMYPKLVEMAQEMSSKGVRIVKFNCNKYNKELGSGLGVRVAPTFFLYKGGVKVAEMTGAHEDKLRDLIEANL